MIINPTVSGGIRLPELTLPAGAGQILSGYQAIDAEGEIITGTIPSQGAQTITPGTSAKTIAAGRYLSGAQTITGDVDLAPGNIRSGANIFGVSGTVIALATGTVTITFNNMWGNLLDVYYTGTNGVVHETLSNGDSITVHPITNSIIGASVANPSTIQDSQNVNVLIDDKRVCLVEYTTGNGKFTVFTGY